MGARQATWPGPSPPGLGHLFALPATHALSSFDSVSPPRMGGMHEYGATAVLVSEPPYRLWQPSRQQIRVAVTLATFGAWVAWPFLHCCWTRESVVQCVLAFFE